MRAFVVAPRPHKYAPKQCACSTPTLDHHMLAPSTCMMCCQPLSSSVCAGRKLLQTTSATGVQTSASSMATQDGTYGNGPYSYG